MIQTRAVGLALVVVGLGLAYWGYQESTSIGSQLNETFTGSLPDKVMMKYIAGAASGVVGLFLVLRR